MMEVFSDWLKIPPTPLRKGGLGDWCVAPIDRNGITQIKLNQELRKCCEYVHARKTDYLHLGHRMTGQPPRQGTTRHHLTTNRLLERRGLTRLLSKRPDASYDYSRRLSR
jgi:hypothetical protein